MSNESRETGIKPPCVYHPASTLTSLVPWYSFTLLTIPLPNQLNFEANPYHIICKCFSLYLKKIRIPLKLIILPLSYLKVNNNSSTHPSVVKFHPVPHIFFFLVGFNLLVCLFVWSRIQPTRFHILLLLRVWQFPSIYKLPVPLSSILCFLCWRNWLFVFEFPKLLNFASYTPWYHSMYTSFP